MAEKELGRPVFKTELSRYFPRVTSLPMINAKAYLEPAIFDLFRNDEILADEQLDRISMNHALQGDNYQLYSDRFAVKFPTYELDGQLKIVPGEHTIALNWNHLKDLMLSTDLSRLPELQKLGEGTPMLLDSKVDMKG